MLDSSYQGVKRLIVLAYDNTDANRVTEDSHRKYFLPRIKIENYNIEIDGRNFCDQPINDLIKQYDEVRKNFNRTRWWLYNRLFIRFCLFKKITD